jgi:Ca2+-binding EF-hand superfamily protein
MMTRRFYISLLRLHPRRFRQRFGDEMLGIFDQCAEKGSLFADAILSLWRQWALRSWRRPVPAFSLSRTAEAVPVFYLGESEIPSTGALMRGALVSVVAFTAICWVMSHRWSQLNLLVGSHHPSRSHLLPVRTMAEPTTDLPSEVKVKPYPFEPPISAYFQLIRVLAALDADRDNVISSTEIDAAPVTLRTLDTNHDGKLSAEECGLHTNAMMDPRLQERMRLAFMRVHPVLAALDANHDGKISSSEIANAAAALRTLDANWDGKLTEAELLPDPAVLIASNIVMALDKNGDGRISSDERSGKLAERFRALLDRADRDKKGFVTEEDLLNEIRSGSKVPPTP